MRSDMAKVIVERPRYGSSLPSQKKGYLKQFQHTPLEEQPRREPMLGHWRGRQRFLNEHLGPMRRFLQSNVGRPWNKVHQELCEYVSFENAVQGHVLDHIYDFVEREVALIQNRPHYARGWRRGCPLRFGQMYICPKTGLLRIVEKYKPRKLPEKLHVSPGIIHILKDGVWWELRVRQVPSDSDELWDVWLERRVASLTKAACIKAYGGEVFALSKRALSRQETQQLLRNRRALNRRRVKQRIRWQAFCTD